MQHDHVIEEGCGVRCGQGENSSSEVDLVSGVDPR